MNNNEKLNGQLRHLLTILAGFMVAKGVIRAEHSEFYTQLILILPGIAVGAFGMVASWLSKKDDQKIDHLIDKIAERMAERKINEP